MKLRIDFWGLVAFVTQKDKSIRVIFVNHPEHHHQPKLAIAVEHLNPHVPTPDEVIATSEGQQAIWRLDNREVQVLADGKPLTGPVAVSDESSGGCPDPADPRTNEYMSWAADLGNAYPGTKALPGLLTDPPNPALVIGRAHLRSGRLWCSGFVSDSKAIPKWKVGHLEQALAEKATYEVENEGILSLGLDTKRKINFVSSDVPMAISSFTRTDHAHISGDGLDHFERFHDLLQPTTTEPAPERVGECSAPVLGGWPIRCAIAQLQE